MYGDFVMMVDAQIGRVLAALDESDATRETLVIFTSDNGPVWNPEDLVKYGHDTAGGLRGMKGDAWEAGHRMPFIVRWPGRVKAGTVTDQTICFTDLLATFAEICGLTDVMEGSIVRAMVRLDETCREFRDAARVMGNTALFQQMEAASAAIKRDVIFAASLYVA